MTKNEFIGITREFFKEKGFHLLKKSKFYMDTRDFVLKVYLQHSDYSELYYFNFDIRIKDLHPMNIKLDDEDYSSWDFCFGRLVENKEYAFTVEYLKVQQEDYLNKLNKIYLQQIKPILVEGLRILLPFNKKGKLYINFKKETEEFLRQLN